MTREEYVRESKRVALDCDEQAKKFNGKFRRMAAGMLLTAIGVSIFSILTGEIIAMIGVVPALIHARFCVLEGRRAVQSFLQCRHNALEDI